MSHRELPFETLERSCTASASYAGQDVGEVIVEILLWPVVILVGGGLLWAVFTEVVYRLARVARRGWEDEGVALRDRPSEDIPHEPVR